MHNGDHDCCQDKVEESVHEGNACFPPLQGKFVPGVIGHGNLDVVRVVFGTLS